ncbi:hypothetical protein BD770DRAFT_406401 [Pilaira anomala]|nr:hypothetical protein BD770DRAFT_406401 [Pilaira anomala]
MPSTSYLYGRVSPTLTERFSLVTTPPCSASPIELAPILDMCDSVDNRPPSPDSPKLKKLTDGVYHHLERFDSSLPPPPPPYLEPSPQFVVEATSNLFSSNLFQVLMKDSTTTQKIPTTTIMHHHNTVQIPIPRRKSCTNQQKSRIILSPSPSTVSVHSLDPMSPTMAAASASAAAAADHRNPGSHVAKSLLKSISSNNKRLLQNDEEVIYHHSTTTNRITPLNIHQKQSNNNNNNVDQSMFLTKNAHIKRPRNAWIHFRCHYGQALKAQDPTLRAEEISKRASRRWGKLTEIEKRPWHGLAEQEKLAHREAFPEYRYCPRRATSSSVTPPSPPAVTNRVRSATASEINPLHLHDVYNIPASIVQRPQKRVKRNSK